MRTLLALSFLAVLPAVDCIPTIGDGQACTTLYAYGVSATVADAATGDPIDNAVLTLTDGDYTEVMQPFPSGGYAGAGERPGHYTLTISVPGVATGTIDDLDLGFDGCHVIGVALDIRVSPGMIIVDR